MRHFTNGDAKEYMTTYLKNEKGNSFKKIVSIEYKETINGQKETCGGCTIHDGQDCTPPEHHIDIFLIITSHDDDSRMRLSDLHMGWSDGGDNCINAFGDYNNVLHQNYYEISKLKSDIANTSIRSREDCEKELYQLLNAGNYLKAGFPKGYAGSKAYVSKIVGITKFMDENYNTKFHLVVQEYCYRLNENCQMQCDSSTLCNCEIENDPTFYFLSSGNKISTADIISLGKQF
jgi:hypothetical protein